MPADREFPVAGARARLRVAALALAGAGLVTVVGGSVSAQTGEPTGPITTLTSTTSTPTTQASTTTTENDPEPTTTTEDDPEPTTTVERTTTTRSRAATTTRSDNSDEFDDSGDFDDADSSGSGTETDGFDDGISEDIESDPTTTELTPTTERDLLVAGDGSSGAESTTTSSTTVVQVEGDDGVSEEAMIWLIVAGLVAIALLVAFWTVRFWRATRPEGAGGDEEPAKDPTTVFGRP